MIVQADFSSSRIISNNNSPTLNDVSVCRHFIQMFSIALINTFFERKGEVIKLSKITELSYYLLSLWNKKICYLMNIKFELFNMNKL